MKNREEVYTNTEQVSQPEDYKRQLEKTALDITKESAAIADAEQNGIYEQGVLEKLKEKLAQSKLAKAALLGIYLNGMAPAATAATEHESGPPPAETIAQQTPPSEDVFIPPGTDWRELKASYENDEAIRAEVDARVEAAKENVIKHIQSPAYLEKLIKEFDGDIAAAKAEQQKRVENTRSIEIDPFTFSAEIEEKTGRSGRFIEGIYSKDENKIRTNVTLLGMADDTLEKTLYHELAHASVRGDEQITEKARKIFKDASDIQIRAPEMMKALNEFYKIYYSNPAEVFARKQMVDREMERLGIKQYGEIFTEKHYDELMEAFREGKLSKDAMEFILSIKNDPKVFAYIFNNIAENDSVENTSIA